MLTVIAASAGAIRTVTRPLLSKKNVTSNSCSDLLWVLAACDTGRSMLAGLEVALQIRPTAVTQVTTSEFPRRAKVTTSVSCGGYGTLWGAGIDRADAAQWAGCVIAR